MRENISWTWESLQATANYPNIGPDFIVKAMNSQPELLEACKKAKVFIEYARYELKPGLSKIGDQFPHQEDADNELKRLKQAIAKAEAKQ